MLKRIAKYSCLLILLLLISSVCLGKSVVTETNKILVVTSYNPDTRSISSHLNTFIEEYSRLGGKDEIVVETINCENLSGMHEWPGRLLELIAKHAESGHLGMIVLMGQEAWATYLSLNEEWVKQFPVLPSLISMNAIPIPRDTINVEEWKPVCINPFKGNTTNFVGGIAYEYDIERNIKLVKDHFPQTQRIAFISDNTYGGVAMQALVKETMKEFPELELILLDGRMDSFISVNEKIRNLPSNTCILIGTWRIDRTENFFIGNSTYMLQKANPTIPAFSVSATGLGHWAIGGYIPDYHNVGVEMAQMVKSFLDEGGREYTEVNPIESKYLFDVQKLNEFGLNTNNLPSQSEFVNAPLDFWEEHRLFVIVCSTAFLSLLIGLLGVGYYAIRVRKLRDNLIVSQEQLIIARDKAEESNRLKSAFLANMSHEIRTPLNAIVGFSEVLVSAEHSPEDRLSYCEIIKKNSDSLLVLINDILDLSRIESGQIKMTLQKENVAGILRDALLTVQQARRTKAEFKLEVSDAEMYLNTDGYRLKQVIVNLLSNASKFTKEGSIVLAMHKDEGICVFSVTDTGCGIPKEKAQKIFERFEKLDEFSQGTGLGLSISKLIVEKLGGEIWVDTSYTQGAKFVFTHPIEN